MTLTTETRPEQITLDANTTIEIFREWSFPQEVLEWWQTASDRLGDIGLFMSPGWLERCWLVWGTPGALFVVVIRRGGHICAVLPCHITGSDRASTIRALAIDVLDVPFEFLLGQDPHAALDAFVRLIELHFPDHQLQFDNLPASSGQQVREAFRARRFSTWTYTEPHAPYISTDGNWETYSASIASKIKDVRRRLRKAEREAEITFADHRAVEGLQQILSESFAIEARGWKGRAGSAVGQDPALEQFVRSVCEWAATEGRLGIKTLRLQQQLIGFSIVLINSGTTFGLKTGFDEHYSRYSPGFALLLELIHESFLDPCCRRLNFLGRQDPWKVAWAKQADTFEWLTVYPRTVQGRCRYLLQHGWKEPLKRQPLLRRAVETIRAGRRPRAASRRTA